MDRRLTANPLPLTSGRVDGESLHASGDVLPADGTRRLRRGELLLAEGLPPAHLVVVRGGAIQVSLTAPGGRRAMVGLVGPGGVLGEEVLDRVHPFRVGLSRGGASGVRPEARAITSSSVSMHTPRQLEQAIRRQPEVATWLAAALGHRILDLQARLTCLLALPVRERTLEVLRDLGSRWGSRKPEGTAVELPLSQEDLGAMVGASRESVNRALHQLVASGLLRRRDRRYVLVDRSGASAAGDRP